MPDATVPSCFQLLTLDSVGSTNEEIKRLAEGGAEDGTLVWAREQTAGRGRRGREWRSPRGNLFCSLLLRPSYPASRAMQLSFVTAVAVSEIVAAVLPPVTSVTCKWPNDVLVGGRKIAGILIESSSAGTGRLDWLAIGVGLNVASHPPTAEGQYPATSLAAEGAEGPGVPDMLERYCRSLRQWMTTWRETGFSAVRHAWLQRAHGLHEPIMVRLERETLAGVFVNLGEDGALVLRQDGVNRLITVGDVFPAKACRGA